MDFSQDGYWSAQMLGVTTFQFYFDLPPHWNRFRIVGVTDARTVIAVDEESHKTYRLSNRKQEALSGPGRVLCVTENGLSVWEDTDTRLVDLVRMTEKPIPVSPVFHLTLTCVNESGYSAGFVTPRSGEQVSYARAWDESGREVVSSSVPNSRVTTIEPFGVRYAAGAIGDFAALWTRDSCVTLTAPGGTSSFVRSVNGSGMCGGWVEMPDGRQGCTWSSDGTPQLLNASEVVAVLEDSSFIVRTSSGYGIGRGGQYSPIRPEDIQSLGSFPVVSIDAISPSGVMVITIQEPISKQMSKAVVGPEARRDNSKA